MSHFPIDTDCQFKKIFKSNFSKTKLLKYFRFSRNEFLIGADDNFEDLFDIIYLFKPVLYRQLNINADNSEIINSYNEHKELTKILIAEFNKKYNIYLMLNCNIV